MSEQLKPCPFCGKVPTNEKMRLPFYTGPKPTVTRCECGAFLNSRRWNTRPIEDKLETKITAAGDLLEQISAWMWKNQGVPEPMWADQFAAVCKMFEPEAES